MNGILSALSLQHIVYNVVIKGLSFFLGKDIFLSFQFNSKQCLIIFFLGYKNFCIGGFLADKTKELKYNYAVGTNSIMY